MTQKALMLGIRKRPRRGITTKSKVASTGLPNFKVKTRIVLDIGGLTLNQADKFIASLKKQGVKVSA